MDLVTHMVPYSLGAPSLLRTQRCRFTIEELNYCRHRLQLLTLQIRKLSNSICLFGSISANYGSWNANVRLISSEPKITSAITHPPLGKARLGQTSPCPSLDSVFAWILLLHFPRTCAHHHIGRHYLCPVPWKRPDETSLRLLS